jgi:hypothetical protein
MSQSWSASQVWEVEDAMSLTSFLADNKDVRERFRQEVPKPKFTVKKDLVAPPLSNRYGMVGTAFDYLLRFYLQRLNPNTVEKGHWVAETAVSLLSGNPILHSKGQEAVSLARSRLTEFLINGQITDELIQSTLLLARLDPIFRAGVGYEDIGIVYDDDVQDLRNLISVVRPTIFKSSEVCLINPTFGEASIMVGGADADLVIDDTLIDIKTSKKFELKGEDFQQLIGYYVLHEIAGIGAVRPKIEINKLAIYFARYAHLQVFEVDTIINKSSFPAFVEWFRHRAREAYGAVKI